MRTHRVLSAIIALTLLASGAQAQVEYRVIDLGVPVDDLGDPIACDLGEGDTIEVIAYGINEYGEIVGATICKDPTGDIIASRAFVWLPQAAYGLPGEVARIIGPLDSGADDINITGKAVGWLGTDPDPGANSNGHVWQLGDLVTPDIVLPLATIRAFGVNDRDSLVPPLPYQVVGDQTRSSRDIGFLWNSDAPAALLNLNQAGGQPRSGAYDLETPPPPLALPVIGGHSTDCDPLFDALCFICPGDIGDASTWMTPALAPMVLEQPTITNSPWEFEPPLNGGVPQRGEARGVNDLDNLAGWGTEDLTGPDCRDRALFWVDYADDPPTNLGSLLPGTPPDESRANEVNEEVFRRVVGRNMTDALAVMWEFTGTDIEDENDWAFVNLVDLDQIDSACLWTPPANALQSGEDIARIDPLVLPSLSCVNDPWVVGFGKHDGEFRAFLLIPVNDACTGDTNCDGTVDVTDLVQVITLDWGPCQDGKLCLGDINGSCEVDVTDLIAVQTNWGTCGESQSASAPPQVAVIIEMFLANPTPDMGALCCELLLELDLP